MVLTSQQFVMNCIVITGDSLAQQEPDPAFNQHYPMISLKIELLYVDVSNVFIIPRLLGEALVQRGIPRLPNKKQ